MTEADLALKRAKAAQQRRNIRIGTAINATSPHYRFIERMDEYKLYHYSDGSYIMTYAKHKPLPRSLQQAWTSTKPESTQS